MREIFERIMIEEQLEESLELFERQRKIWDKFEENLKNHQKNLKKKKKFS